ncbi:MAG: cation:proton antiporter [Pseudobdellovibrionaceae bacterium]|jgi:CPA2 family monovalent cation:H+ antiporter-2
MHTLPQLITDLALILLTAAGTALLFRFLRLPMILGYLLAGMVVGPAFDLFPTVKDSEAIKVWGELGIIFLLFSLGLEFNFKKLTSVGGPAVLAAMIQILGMFAVGFAFGQFMDWNTTTSLFLGAILSISSTSIIIKSFEEQNLKSKGFANMVFGILIVEDIVAVLFIVLLTTLTLSQEVSGLSLGLESLKLSFFLVLWFVTGLFIIPQLLKAIRNFLTDELALITSMAFCLGMVVIASEAGFSAALGAFIMGSLIGESEQQHRIEKLLSPIKDLFAAIFFVSVGMLVEPQVFVDQPGLIVGLSLTVILGKIFFASAGGMLVGQSPKAALETGISLSQIGEFSFIFAGIAIAGKVAGEELYALSVGVCLVTSFTTPFLLKKREVLVHRLSHLIPQKFIAQFQQYSETSRLISASPEWRQVITSYFQKILINAVISVALFLVVSKFLYPFLMTELDNRRWAQFLSLGSAILLASPFLWALVFAKPSDSTVGELLKTKMSIHLRRTLLGLRLCLALGILTSLLSQLVGLKFVLGISLILFTVLFYFLYRYLEPVYNWFESRFLSQLDRTHKKQKSLPVMVPWDAHKAELIAPAESLMIGKRLFDLNLKEKYGVIITGMERGHRFISPPTRDEMIMPGDLLHLIGSDEQIETFEKDLIQLHQDSGGNLAEEMSLEPLLLTEQSSLIGVKVRSSLIREKFDGLLVGVERQGQRILNPQLDLEFSSGDILWIVGNRRKIKNPEES